MHYFNADARDGGASQRAACDTCCCHPLFIRPGETALVQINFAPWSLPIAPPGLIPGSTQYTVDHNTDGCANNLVDGFLPPTNTNYNLSTPVNTALPVNLAANASPAGNDMRYDVVPLAGPMNGTIVQAPAGADVMTYTPAGGFTGYDYFSYRMTDAQGRSIVRNVRISVGSHNNLPDVGRMSEVPFVDLRKSKVNQAMHTLTFPVTMPYSCRPCDTYRLTVRQTAMDCERNTLFNDVCFDLRCRDCG